ncbi:hypothetical protein FGA82_06930 [Pseudomonas fluorescens]|nr:hypothetical protein FGA82_06930 [Pseudomonas fluorescens]
MFNLDEFRFNSHHLLVALDGATNHLMMLVVAKEVSGARWDEAVICHKGAYDAWTMLLSTAPPCVEP